MNLHQLKNFTRVDLKPEEFDRAVYQRGVRAIWEKAMLCSCIDKHTKQPDFSCPACEGKAFIYFDPKEIRALVYGASMDVDKSPIGFVDIGVAYMTTMSTDLVAFRDRITFPDFTTVYSEVLTYNGSEVKLKYKVQEFVSLRVLDQEIDPSLYSISEDKQKIIFQPGVLQNEERFSVLYRINPVYIVIDIPHELRGTFVKFGYPDEKWHLLPRQLMIKREDLLPLQRGQLLEGSN